jgi:pectate lyase
MIVTLLSFVLNISLISNSNVDSVKPAEFPSAARVSRSVPLWFPKAPPLEPPQAEVIRVVNVDELFLAIEHVSEGGTILLSEGHYKLPRAIVLQKKNNITIRSGAGDPDKVILSGKGWDSKVKGDDILRIGRCEGVTIADLTFAECRSYGIKVEAENEPKDICIYNCRFRNIGVRAIKGSAGKDPNARAVRGSVTYCHFENTKVPPVNWLFRGDYISAIDMMALEDWTFSDNVFRNIKGRSGGGRAAIFIWVRSRRVVVERNLIINCDRGVAFGNPGQSTANITGEQLVYVQDGIIRNNFITGGPDCGIELWYAQNIKVLNNSIWRPRRNFSRGIRLGTGTSNTDIMNNLVHGEIRFDGGKALLQQNLTGHLDNYFIDPASGNLALTRAAIEAIDKGVSLTGVTEDIRRLHRPEFPDLGAWEFENKSKEEAKKVRVKNSSELSRAISTIRPGTTLLLEPGLYSGGIYLRNIEGKDKQPVVIEAADPDNPPVFTGGRQAIHLADCSNIIMRNIKVKGFPVNGINIDDGGSYETPAHHIVLENLTIIEIGPKGNHDALKMSGVDYFVVRKCRFEGWGGSGIDMVGCHNGIIEDCTFIGREGFEQSNAVQLKGGTQDVLVQCCFFNNAGQRSINLGGSTGLQFFRPKVSDYEARNITIAGNRFVGSMSPVSWVTSDGGYVHHNTIVLPAKWVLRILQETSDARFMPCHDGIFERNLIIFDSKVQTYVNVGPGTSPETFRFQQNAWLDLDRSRKPSLPVPETESIYLRNTSIDHKALMDVKFELDDERVKRIGAQAYERAK